MIKLGKMTDYAIVVMGQLSKEAKDAACSAHYLSAKIGVPEPTVAKVLKLLTKENLVVSLRGAAGGYRLAKAPEQTSLAEIITALEGPITIVSCVDGKETDCKSQAMCPVKGNWDRVNEAIREALEGVSLSEMAASSCGKKINFINIKALNVDYA